MYPLLLLTVGSVMSCYALVGAYTDALAGALLQAGRREHAGSRSLPSQLSGCPILQQEPGRREIPAAVPTEAKCLPLCAAFVKRREENPGPSRVTARCGPAGTPQASPEGRGAWPGLQNPHRLATLRVPPTGCTEGP